MRDFVSIVLARKPASFGREFVVAVVILLRVLASVVVAGSSYQMLEILAFCNRERCFPPSITITGLIFLVKKKSTIKNSGVSIF